MHNRIALCYITVALVLTPAQSTNFSRHDKFEGSGNSIEVRRQHRTSRFHARESTAEPEFSGIMENMTIQAGRSVRLSCSVRNLASFRVAWMHYEQSAILAVQNTVITRNPRISVSHEDHRTWNLHIADVRREDGGRYMCQINTATAKTQFAYLNVVVAPDIDDSLSSSDVITREGSNVTLSCTAYGSPQPNIRWRREDNQLININKTLAVQEHEGSTLEMTRISRLDMGGYLCIASNGVPPSVSKRIKLSVDFPPMLWIPHQLVGAPQGYNVSLECFAEAHPASLNYWTREDGQMLHDSNKYRVQTRPLDLPYKTQMLLTVVHLRPQDFGTYKCVAKNPRGETDGTIRLYEIVLSEPQSEIVNNEVLPVANNRTTDKETVTNLDKGVKLDKGLSSLEFLNKDFKNRPSIYDTSNSGASATRSAAGEGGSGCSPSLIPYLHLLILLHLCFT